MMISLSIIIVSFNTKDLLSSCLKSIQKNTSPSFYKTLEIIIIDNNSTDGTPLLIKKSFPNVRFIENYKNIGYSRANNQGIKVAKGDYILLLNSDTVLSPNALECMIKHISENPSAGVAGPKLLNTDKSLQSSLGFLPNLFNIFLWMNFVDDIPALNNILPAYHIESTQFYKRQQKVGWVSGAFFLFKKKVIKTSGVLDENIFMYGEEVEWCMRIRRSGWEIIYFPDVEITHLKGKSGIGQNAGIVEEFNALKYIFSKHKPRWQNFVLRIILIWGAWLRILLFGIIQRDKSKFKIYAKAFKVA